MARRAEASRQGFTLIEVLVTMTIMAVIGAVLVTTLATISRSWQSADARGERLRCLQDLFLISWYDFSQAVPFRAAAASFSSPLILHDAPDEAFVERRGWSNPFGLPRSNVEAVHFTYLDHRVRRYSLPAGELAGTTVAVAADILAGQSRLLAENVGVQTAVIDGKGNPYVNWGDDGQSKAALPPQCLSLRFEMAPFGTIEEDIPLVLWHENEQSDATLPSTTR